MTEERMLQCPACGGQGGGGDDRCAIVVCEDCDGTGVRPPATSGS